MRVVLLILLIALAPLRGMANELMATRMASALVASVTLAVNPGTPGKSPVEGHHCEDMASSATLEHTAPAATVAAAHHADPAASNAPHGGCENCSLCQMCASIALPAVVPLAQPLFGPQLRLPVQADRFASAPAALAQKPPIS